MARKRKVQESWETEVVSSRDTPYVFLYVPHKGRMYLTSAKGFIAGDRVRVTVERLPRGKKERK